MGAHQQVSTARATRLLALACVPAVLAGLYAAVDTPEYGAQPKAEVRSQRYKTLIKDIISDW